jgi:hypothetical protein
MTTQITVTLPDAVLRRAELLAQRTGRAVADVLAETIELSLRPLGTASGGGAPVTDLSDADVLAAAEAELSAAEDARLSELLDRQQAGRLDNGERAELSALIERYEAGLLRKAQALREAVRRGMREPLRP